MPASFPLAMDMALVTDQHREDVSCMRFSHIKDGRLYVKQIKTGMKIALLLSLMLPAVGLRFEAVVDLCRLLRWTDFRISAGIRKKSPDGAA